MYCADPNCGVQGPHIHDGPGDTRTVVESLRERLQDFEKENAVLRETISDAWQTYNNCQEALAEAQGQVQELSAQMQMLSQYLLDTSVGFECLSGCSATGHEPMCPVKNPVAAWRLTRDQLKQLTLQLDQSRAEVKELKRLIQGLDTDPV
jgi:hypothetical protein